MNGDWFRTQKISDYLYLTTEPHFGIGNRCNCWLIKGPGKDVVIDTGLGVQNLKTYFENLGLIDKAVTGEKNCRPCEVIITHVHFDHSGGAHHFPDVYIHREDSAGLRAGRQTETLNYVKAEHFNKAPFTEFSAFRYKVPPTPCQSIRDGDKIDLGSGDYLQIIHTPGHTKGSICVYYPSKRALFSGDFVYECGSGQNLLDWLPTSCVKDYVHSANSMVDFLSEDKVDHVYPGHFNICRSQRIQNLLQEYSETKDNCCSIGRSSCLQCTTWGYFLFGGFRCCPC